MNVPEDTVLVTGASGFTGRHLVDRLLKQGSRVVGTTRSVAAAEFPQQVDWIAIDLTDQGAVEQLIATVRPTRIFHLAGIVRGEPEKIYRTNFQATLNLLTAVSRYASRARVLCVGSAAEYGIPIDPHEPLCEETRCHPAGSYATSKFCQTKLVTDFAAEHNLRGVVARPFNLIGPGVPANLLVGAILSRMRKTLSEDAQPTISTGNLENARDFLDVRDAISAYVALLDTDCWGQTFNICSGQPTPIRAVVKILLSCCRRPPHIVTDPALFRHHDPPCVFGSTQKLCRHISFQPRYPLRESLQAAWSAVMENDTPCGSQS
jgi:GDP-4-dehydro-6-deoxy-D-mannose reductase